jgi:hypothetical protein
MASTRKSIMRYEELELMRCFVIENNIQNFPKVTLTKDLVEER